MKKKDVFIIGKVNTDKYFKEVTRQLIESGDMHGYMSHALYEEENSLSFVDATLLYRIDLMHHAFSKTEWTYGSSVTIDSLNGSRAEVYAALDRVSPNLKSSMQKEMYFNKLAGYMLGYFEANPGIKKIICQNVPHMPWDILFVRVAELFGIMVFSVNRVIEGYSVIWRGVGPDAQMCGRVTLEDKEIDNVMSLINGYNEKFIGRLNHRKLNGSASKLSKLRKEITSCVPAIRFAKTFLRAFVEPFPVQKYPANKSSKQYSNFAGEAEITRIRYVLSKLLYLYRKESVTKRLDELGVRKPDLNKNFFYFAMHYQPEKSTLPEGSVYRDQVMAIRRIAEYLPEDFCLYVKEHPKQPSNDIRNGHFRSPSVYDEIKKINKVKLIHHSADSKELIKNAHIVLSVTGSVLTEAISSGTPAIAFGMSFLDGCDSLVNLGSGNVTVRSAVSYLLEKKEKEVIDDFRVFIKNPCWQKVCSRETAWEEVGLDYSYVDNLVNVIRETNAK